MKRLAIRHVWGAGDRASIRLARIAREAAYDIAGRKCCTVYDLISEIDRKRRGSNFDAATRSYVAYYRAVMRGALWGNAGSVAR